MLYLLLLLFHFVLLDDPNNYIFDRVIRITPFANRLAMNLPPQIQSLRCLANYEALRFSTPILALARKLVNRMTKNSSISDGKFVSVHLRFEEVKFVSSVLASLFFFM